MQGAMVAVPKDSVNPFFHSRYSSLGAIWDAIRKPLSENGLSVVQTTFEREDRLFLKTTLFHSSGQWLETDYPISVAKSDPQSIGSALSYSRRYSLCGLLGVSSEEDDDGNAASGNTAKAPASKPTAKTGPMQVVPSTSVLQPNPSEKDETIEEQSKRQALVAQITADMADVMVSAAQLHKDAEKKDGVSNWQYASLPYLDSLAKRMAAQVAEKAMAQAREDGE
ncbi:MAG: ERF family protein [Dehalococcoidia bacterium]|nr:ERF family protein [Dehalococcoidia bacterium]